jgi:protein phosphatase
MITQRYDIIGDVHGCYDELQELVALLGQRATDDAQRSGDVGDAIRTLVFVGDLVDRGPRTPDVLRDVMSLVHSGKGLCVRGNHDDKLLRYLRGKKVIVNNGLEESVAQLNACTAAFRDEAADFIESMPYYLTLNDGTLIVAHAGLEQRLHNEAKHPRNSDAVRSFALYGSTTGKKDELGLPVRLNWAADYQGEPTIVYGHTPVREPHWQNNTINIDTGCVFGGRLTALRYPERELVSIPAKKEYAIPRRSL